MDPDTLRTWQGVIRDLVIVALGAFVLIYETIGAREPNPYLIGAGLVLLGVPPALRTDEKLRRGKDAIDDVRDRWSGLP